jgi:hypothetical protein
MSFSKLHDESTKNVIYPGKKYQKRKEGPCSSLTIQIDGKTYGVEDSTQSRLLIFYSLANTNTSFLQT